MVWHWKCNDAWYEWVLLPHTSHLLSLSISLNLGTVVVVVVIGGGGGGVVVVGGGGGRRGFGGIIIIIITIIVVIIIIAVVVVVNVLESLFCHNKVSMLCNFVCAQWGLECDWLLNSGNEPANKLLCCANVPLLTLDIGGNPKFDVRFGEGSKVYRTKEAYTVRQLLEITTN